VPRAVETADAPREAGSEEKRESRSRRGRGNRRSRETSPELAETDSSVPHAVIETAGFRAIIEIARKPRAIHAPAAVAPAQQALQLETAAAPTASPTDAATVSPAIIPEDPAAQQASLEQVETRGAAVDATEHSEASRPRRRRRPTVNQEVETVSLMQVETTTPVTSAVEVATAAPHPTRRRSRPQVPPPQEPLVQVETQSN